MVPAKPGMKLYIEEDLWLKSHACSVASGGSDCKVDSDALAKSRRRAASVQPNALVLQSELPGDTNRRTMHKRPLMLALGRVAPVLQCESRA